MKRIVTIQDISCLGKCALTVALPVISAMGVETSVIPTSLFSVHSEFPEYVFHDLTPQVPAIMDHWRKEGFQFDGIYAGYLGSLDQMRLVSQFVDDFKTPDNFFFLDPVLGDKGDFYPDRTPEFAAEMVTLCAKADVIVPNLTEACLLLGKPYPAGVPDEAYIRALLLELSALGARQVAITGVSFSSDQIGVMAYDSQTKEYFQYFDAQLPVHFHGTGDVFASTCVGALTRGATLAQALMLALDFTLASIQKSMRDPQRRWYSVNFEEALPSLIRQVEALFPSP